jgi:hypothetical protein
MNDEGYRAMALALPGAIELSHMNHPDFRVGGRIFATLWPTRRQGVAMLTPEQQEILTGAHPLWFSPAAGAWGRRGSTVIALDGIDEEVLRHALEMAWRNKAPRALVVEYEEGEFDK